MEVVILPDAAALGRHGADAVAAHVAARPEAVLGLATGSSPLPVYDELARRVRDGELSLRSCRAFLLDEYVGLPAGHPESYRTVIEREFVVRTDIAPEAVHGPDGGAADVPGACAAYEEALREAGGVDVQLHPPVTVLVDEAAAGRLELAGEYRHMWEAKPSWQGL